MAGGSRVRAGVLGVALVLVGLLAWGVARVFAGMQPVAYAPNAVAPDTVHLTAGHTYELSWPGGVRALAAAGMPPSQLDCEWQSPGRTPQELSVQTVPSDTTLTDRVASFVAPRGGDLVVTCSGLGPVFVDDADDTVPDAADAFLVVASAALAVGGVACLAQLHRARRTG
ncbi:MAG: hypothetical protein ACTHMS_23890 [Jatrophihabitans sp.]|uniref:hypothetical protein n=1 Tax=Jatrophihabitans sp. TaxID=1932789 RepID=UPI003F7E3AD0